MSSLLCYGKARSHSRLLDNRHELRAPANLCICSAATNNQTGEGVAIKKVTNVFSKKILAKRALREIKLLQHFRGHRNVCTILSLPRRQAGRYGSTLHLADGCDRSRAFTTWIFRDQITLTRRIYMKVRRAPGWVKCHNANSS